MDRGRPGPVGGTFAGVTSGVAHLTAAEERTLSRAVLYLVDPYLHRGSAGAPPDALRVAWLWTAFPDLTGLPHAGPDADPESGCSAGESGAPDDAATGG